MEKEVTIKTLHRRKLSWGDIVVTAPRVSQHFQATIKILSLASQVTLVGAEKGSGMMVLQNAYGHACRRLPVVINEHHSKV